MGSGFVAMDGGPNQTVKLQGNPESGDLEIVRFQDSNFTRRAKVPNFCPATGRVV